MILFGLAVRAGLRKRCWGSSQQLPCSLPALPGPFLALQLLDLFTLIKLEVMLPSSFQLGNVMSDANMGILWKNSTQVTLGPTSALSCESLSAAEEPA